MDPPRARQRAVAAGSAARRRDACRRTRTTSGDSPTGSSTSSSPTVAASSSASTESPSRHWRSPICSAFPTRIARRSAAISAPAMRPATRSAPSISTPVGSNPLKYLDDLFSGYIAERRSTPREDVLTGLATATYPDGSIPPLLEVVRPATFLFGAGQETVTKLLSSAVQVLGDRPDLQQRLRADRWPDRRRSSRKRCASRARPRSTSGWRARPPRWAECPSRPAPCSCCAWVPPIATPESSSNPNEFQLDRKNVREHIAFGRGIHTCAGAPLARVEGRVTINRMLDRMRDIRISEAKHGPRRSSRLPLRADVPAAWTHRTAHRVHRGDLTQSDRRRNDREHPVSCRQSSTSSAADPAPAR